MIPVPVCGDGLVPTAVEAHPAPEPRPTREECPARSPCRMVERKPRCGGGGDSPRRNRQPAKQRDDATRAGRLLKLVVRGWRGDGLALAGYSHRVCRHHRRIATVNDRPSKPTPATLGHVVPESSEHARPARTVLEDRVEWLVWRRSPLSLPGGFTGQGNVGGHEHDRTNSDCWRPAPARRTSRLAARRSSPGGIGTAPQLDLRSQLDVPRTSPRGDSERGNSGAGTEP